MTATATRTIPAPALWLGLGGLLPFFGLSAGLWVTTGPLALGLCTALVAYGAVILSFMGGVHWGAAMQGPEGPSWGRLVASVLPALVAWPTVLMPVPGLGVLMAGFLALLVYDLSLVKRGQLVSWYSHLRLVLTAGVELSLGLAIAALVA